MAWLELSWLDRKGEHSSNKTMRANEGVFRIIYDCMCFVEQILCAGFGKCSGFPEARTKNRCVLANTAAGKGELRFELEGKLQAELHDTR